jgi:AcrR family transcriptional regulator
MKDPIATPAAIRTIQALLVFRVTAGALQVGARRDCAPWSNLFVLGPAAEESSKLVMAKKDKARRQSREDWLKLALETMSVRGVDGVKVAVLATQLGVTTGSFYWHFENRRDLLDELVDWWEREMTDAAIEAAEQFVGSPEDRILYLMRQVMIDKLARYDVAVWLWALSDRRAARVFRRALKKRFEFAAKMFEEAGFSKVQATARGRMMVVHMMGESTLIPASMSESLESIRLDHAILTAPNSPVDE